MNRQGTGKIDYADYSWNVYTGCLNSCSYCFARRQAKRFAYNVGGKHEVRDGVLIAQPGDIFPENFMPTFYPHRLAEPSKVRKPSVILVSDMGDLWESGIPREMQHQVLRVCAQNPQHTFLMLTKSPENYPAIVPENVWLGATIEHPGADDPRAPVLVHRNPETWISYEPLLSRPYSFAALTRWIVIGAMTGPGSKAHQPERSWVADLLRMARDYDIPVFMKDSLAAIWGEPIPKETPWQK